MNFRILAKFLGALLLLQSLAMAGCGIFAWADSAAENAAARDALFLSAGIVALGGTLPVSYTHLTLPTIYSV